MNQPASNLDLRQPSLPDLCPITAAIAELANSGVEARGAVFTRRVVVDFILDLVGYTPNRSLCKLRLLEPSFGNGDFLLPAVARLLTSWTPSRRKQDDPSIELADCIRAVELH